MKTSNNVVHSIQTSIGRRLLIIAASAAVATIALVYGVSIGLGNYGWTAVLPALVVACAVLRSPELGLYLMIATIPVTGYLPDVPLVSSLTAMLGVLTLGSLFTHVATRRLALRRPSNIVYVGIVGFGISMLLSALFGQGFSLVRILTFFQLFVLVYVLDQWFNSRQHLRRLMTVWILSLGAVQVWGLLHFDFESLGRQNRLESLVDNPNYLAFFSLVGVWFWLYYFSESHSVARRTLTLAGLVLSIATIVLTNSRAGLLAMILGFFYWIWMWRRQRFWLLAVFTASLVAIASVIGNNYFQELTNNVTSATKTLLAAVISDPEGYQDASARAFIWRSGIATWSESPVFGVGIGASRALHAFAFSTDRRFIADVAGHNAFINVLVETGLVGLFFFLVVFIGSFHNLVNSHIAVPSTADIRRAWLGAWISMACMCLSSNLEADKLLWLIIGGSVVLARLCQTSASTPSRREHSSIRIEPAQC